MAPLRLRPLALPLLVVAAAATLSSAFLSPSLSPGARRLHLTQRPPAAAVRAARVTMSAGKEWALIFDCDGVILEVWDSFIECMHALSDGWTDGPTDPDPLTLSQSESLHREAYNAMFKEFEIAYHWDEDYYDELQNKIGGFVAWIKRPMYRGVFRPYSIDRHKCSTCHKMQGHPQDALLLRGARVADQQARARPRRAERAGGDAEHAAGPQDGHLQRDDPGRHGHGAFSGGGLHDPSYPPATIRSFQSIVQ